MHRPSPVSMACAAALGLAFAAPFAQAADSDITTSFSGYGTVAAAMTSNGKYEFANNLAQFKGATDQLDIGGDSRLGLQGTVNFGSQFSVVAQALAQRVGDKDFDIGTEWLFGQYEASPGLDLRLGRVVMPTFLYSDTRNVGYAQTWLRAPNEVYSLMPFKTLDGAQALWRVATGPASITTSLSYGKTSATLQSQGTTFNSQGKNVINLGVTAELGDWTARVSETRMDLPEDLDLSAIGLGTLAYTVKDKYLSAGVQYDNGTAIFMSEWTRRSQNDMPVLGVPLLAGTNWYAAAGWRFGKFTPLVRYVKTQHTTSLIGPPSQSSVGASLRYDVYRNVALKAQVDRYDAANPAAFLNATGTTGTKVTVMSLGADFVF